MPDEPLPEPSFSCPLPLSAPATIQLAHGSGGRLANDLIARLFVEAFDNPMLRRQDDQATVEIDGLRLSFSTDSFVVDPLFFPGGDIGDLAVNGTVNDLSMNGARPLFLSAGFIIEEGLPIADLARVVQSMRKAAAAAGVQIVTGDTKVVNRGKGDKLFINTAGIGVISHPYDIGVDRLRPGDRVLISGPLGNHGLAVLSRREGLAFESPIVSDTAPLNGLVAALVAGVGGALHAMRDPTRGGLAATLNEFARASRVGIRLVGAQVPIDPPVAGACELLGLDPLYVANEGKLTAVVSAEAADRALALMRAHPLGARAAVIGEVHADRPGE
ncbi:MAG TPA: hydrogenase expression/formation protein HypE, partial [candidate division Zixibacteria bacterium]|nr:hydrogenase expression/formation protein HypE [candidate division Zixibacteria bacterium]